MPELPDLIYIEKKLNSILPGLSITEITVSEPIVLRILVAGRFEELLLNYRFAEVVRHGPFLDFKFENGMEMILHPMLAGKLKHAPSGRKPGRGHCFSFALSDGHLLHYLDDKKMGKVYLIEEGCHKQIPRYQQQGVDILTDAFTLTKFKALIKKRRNQVRVFLMDQTALSAIGNAYADEILFHARIHPKTFCYQLAEAEIEQLYESIRSVIQWGIDEVENAQQPIEVKVRDHVKVRNRKDQPCPECRTTIRRAGVLGHDAFFCPGCQPPVRKQFIDWSGA